MTSASTSTANFKFGTLTSGTPFVIGAADLTLPATMTLTSAAGGRLIELSTDGVNFYTPTYDATTANMVNVSIRSPIRVIRITGANADTWNLR